MTPSVLSSREISTPDTPSVARTTFGSSREPAYSMTARSPPDASATGACAAAGVLPSADSGAPTGDPWTAATSDIGFVPSLVSRRTSRLILARQASHGANAVAERGAGPPRDRGRPDCVDGSLARVDGSLARLADCWPRHRCRRYGRGLPCRPAVPAQPEDTRADSSTSSPE